MDYLFELNLKDKSLHYIIEGYFVIDKRLSYVSTIGDKYYRLLYIDTDTIGECVLESTCIGDLDYWVLEHSQPIKSQVCKYKDDKRIITITTPGGNSIPIKRKERTTNTPIVRFNGNKKLF